MCLKSLKFGFKLSKMLIEMNTNEVSEEQALERPEDGGNCMNWILGHILFARKGLLTLLGAPLPAAFERIDIYKRGSSGDVADDHLDLATLKATIAETSDTILKLLNEMKDEQLTQEIPADRFPIPVEEPTLWTMLHLLMMHEGYHVGQIGLARRIAGGEPVIR